MISKWAASQRSMRSGCRVATGRSTSPPVADSSADHDSQTDIVTKSSSKKFDNHAHAVALHFMYMNFARPHKCLANPYPRTPAMAAGPADHVWTMEEIAGLLD